jgi:hypothetical protein
VSSFPRGDNQSQPIGSIDLVSSVLERDNLLVRLILYLVVSVYLKGTTYWYTTSGTIDSVSSFPEGVNLLVQLILCLVYLKGTTYILALVILGLVYCT